MKNKTFFIALSMIFVCMSLVCSCKKDPRKEYNSCCKTIKKNLGRKAPNNLDEAIGAMDWESAHKYIGCYALLPEEKKSNNVIRAVVSSDKYNEESEKPHETSVMRDAKERLLRAEATYLIQSGAPEKAQAVATELGVIDIYQELLAEQFSSMMKEKRYDEVISVLSNWKFEQDFVKQREHRSNHVDPTDNDWYNSEVSTYNDYVDALLN